MAIDRIFSSGTSAGNPERAHVIRPGSQSERTEFASSDCFSLWETAHLPLAEAIILCEK